MQLVPKTLQLLLRPREDPVWCRSRFSLIQSGTGFPRLTLGSSVSTLTKTPERNAPV